MAINAGRKIRNICRKLTHDIVGYEEYDDGHEEIGEDEDTLGESESPHISTIESGETESSEDYQDDTETRNPLFHDVHTGNMRYTQKCYTDDADHEYERFWVDDDDSHDGDGGCCRGESEEIGVIVLTLHRESYEAVKYRTDVES